MNLTVSSLVRYLKNKLDLDDNIQNITVKGEISNFHKHNSGHLYFTLKDEKASISCVMFSSRALSLKFMPKNGDKVIVTANVSLFESAGQLQLYVNSIILDGIGDLYQRFEELKIKLSSEGLFNEEHKKVIPTFYPSKIAVLVGENSAAMSDIKICFKRRWPLTKVDYYPCLVQGLDAPKDIISKLLEVDDKEYEIIVLARGGGSFEDLFCFNDENLARTIYNLKTFIITGIGHEQDFSIADFVADVRAATPTAAIELITPNIEDVEMEIDNYYDFLQSSINTKINNYKKQIQMLSNNHILLNPRKILENKYIKIKYLNTKLNNYLNILINTKRNIEIIKGKIINNIENKLKINKIKLDKYLSLLKAYSYENTLQRGFTITYLNEKIVKNINEIKENDLLNIKFINGNINTIVKEIKKDGKE